MSQETNHDFPIYLPLNQRVGCDSQVFAMSSENNELVFIHCSEFRSSFIWGLSGNNKWFKIYATLLAFWGYVREVAVSLVQTLQYYRASFPTRYSPFGHECVVRDSHYLGHSEEP